MKGSACESTQGAAPAATSVSMANAFTAAGPAPRGFGANVRFPIAEGTERVYRKVWEMGALAV